MGKHCLYGQRVLLLIALEPTLIITQKFTYCYICKVMNSNICGFDSSNGRALVYCMKGQEFDPEISMKFFWIKCLALL